MFRSFKIILSVLLVLTLPVQSAFASNPIEIKNVEDFLRIDSNSHDSYRLVSSLDLANDDLDTLTPETETTNDFTLVRTTYLGDFRGNFDGNGKTISGLDKPLFSSIQGSISNLTLRTLDLGVSGFGVLANNAEATTIVNVKTYGRLNGGDSNRVGGIVGILDLDSSIERSIADVNVSSEAGAYIGGLVGASYGLISDSAAHGDVSGAAWVGGLAGYSGGTVSRSQATGYVNGLMNDVGGLIGASGGLITDSFSLGSVNGETYVGGLVGYSSQNISQSYAMGDVSGTDYVGGLIGMINGGISINSAYASGDVTATGDGIGGLVGASLDYVTIENTISFGNVRGRYGVGGLVGDLFGRISNSSALGDVSGVGSIGGLAGRMALFSNSEISYSGAHGAVSGSEDIIGGLVGFMHETNLIKHSYSTGQVRGREDVGGLVGQAYGGISSSWAEGEVVTDGDPGGPFVGFCVYPFPTTCDPELSEVPAGFATNYDPNPSIATLPPNKNEQLEILNTGLAVNSPAFAISSCFNSGRPYLLSLTSAYSSACNSIRSKYYIKSLINKPSVVKGFNLSQKDLKKYGIDVVADDDKSLPQLMEEAQINASDSSNFITSRGNGLQFIINSNSNSPIQFWLELSNSERILIGVIDFEKYSSATLPMFKFITSNQIKFLLVESSELNSKEPNLNSLKGQINLTITD